MNEEATVVTEGWITTNEAVEETGYGAEYLRQMARGGKVKAEKLAGRWLFNRDELLAHKQRMEELGRKRYGIWTEREQ